MSIADRPGIDILSEIESIVAQHRIVIGSLLVRRSDAARSDLSIYVPHATHHQCDAVCSNLERSRIAIEATVTGPGRLGLRLTDAAIEHSWESLLQRKSTGLLSTHLAGRSHLVDFGDPNTNKPLHIGHLRNIAIGNAWASLLSRCGSEVRRQMVLCDIGRGVAEAIAGYIQSGEERLPATERGDLFVGRCYAHYERQHPSDGRAAMADPASRESLIVNDEAEEILLAWAAGEGRVRRLWKSLRRVAIEGQLRTLDRLQATVDLFALESLSVDRCQLLVQKSLELGIASRGPAGDVYWVTAQQEHPVLPMLRADGFPTEHMRGLAIWDSILAEDGVSSSYLHVMGEEWTAATRCRLQLLSRLDPIRPQPLYHVISCGMVNVDGRNMKSSGDNAVLIDDALDFIAASQPMQALVEGYNDPDLIEDLARIVLVGFLLLPPVTKIIDFDWNRVLDAGSNRAWDLAAAWARVRTRRTTCGHPTRVVALQALLLPRIATHTVLTLDLAHVLRYLLAFAQLADSQDGSNSASAAIPIELGLSAVGLV